MKRKVAIITSNVDVGDTIQMEIVREGRRLTLPVHLLAAPRE